MEEGQTPNNTRKLDEAPAHAAIRLMAQQERLKDPQAQEQCCEEVLTIVDRYGVGVILAALGSVLLVSAGPGHEAHRAVYHDGVTAAELLQQQADLRKYGMVLMQIAEKTRGVFFMSGVVKDGQIQEPQIDNDPEP